MTGLTLHPLLIVLIVVGTNHGPLPNVMITNCLPQGGTGRLDNTAHSLPCLQSGHHLRKGMGLVFMWLRNPGLAGTYYFCLNATTFCDFTSKGLTGNPHKLLEYGTWYDAVHFSTWKGTEKEAIAVSSMLPSWHLWMQENWHASVNSNPNLGYVPHFVSCWLLQSVTSGEGCTGGICVSWIGASISLRFTLGFSWRIWSTWVFIS